MAPNPTAAPAEPIPTAAVPAAPRPVVPTRIGPVRPSNRPSVPVTVRPLGPSVVSRPTFQSTAARSERLTLTPENIQILAKRERVPARIAKGELEGKMKCRIWKKLHPEEARRFDLAYTLLQQSPELDLSEAFGIVQGGLSVDEFRQRRTKAKKKEDVKEARQTVSNETINAFIDGLKANQTVASVILGERSFLDVIKDVENIAFVFERVGRIEKLNVVLLTTQRHWESIAAQLIRDPKLTQKPLPVARQPMRRPVHDPRPFLGLVGQPVVVRLRNGIQVTDTLQAVGAYDLLLGNAEQTMLVPLHAITHWHQAPSPAA